MIRKLLPTLLTLGVLGALLASRTASTRPKQP